jgi:hypothetical protein
MSHLLEQVRRTTELFFSSDEEYREELLKLTKKLRKVASSNAVRTSERATVCGCITDEGSHSCAHPSRFQTFNVLPKKLILHAARLD